MSRKPSQRAYIRNRVLDIFSLTVTSVFFVHVGYHFYLLGWKDFIAVLLLNPLLGGDGSRLRDDHVSLPLFTYEVGHFLPGIILQLIGQSLFYLFAREWKYVPSVEREDMRAFLTSVVSLGGSAPFLAPLHKMAFESSYSKLYFDIHQYPVWWAVLSLFLASAFIETFFWWVHWYAHYNTWFYDNIHSVHHSFVPSTSSCASAFHPMDITLLTLGSFFVSLVIPLHFMIHSGYLLFCLFWTLLVHTGFRARLPRPLAMIFNDPSMHNLHHDYGRRGVNLGSLLCLWDHVC